MATGLAVSDVVTVNVTLSPLASPRRNFGVGLVVGPSAVINTSERIRTYSTIAGVAADFSSTDPEYLAAVKFFSQSPTPSILKIGRWAQTASSAVLFGGALSASEQVMSNWTSITNGGFSIDIDGTTVDVTALDFSSETNLNGIAALITTALDPDATCVWNATYGRFEITSATTGATSTLGYAVPPASGTNLAPLLKLANGVASAPVDGIAAEDLVDALQALADASSDWYAAILATGTLPSNAAILAASDYIEASGKKRIFGLTVTSSTALDGTSTSDTGYLLSEAEYKRTFVQYSADAYAVASFFGRAATVDFTGSKTTLTMKFKTEPGVTPENLTETQAAALAAKHINVFVDYDNDTSIIQEGVMSNGYFFDEVHGLDWLEDAIQTEVWNLLYTSKTKIPQTNAGMALIAAKIENVLHQAVANGLVAPGQWNADGFGALENGDYLENGYYVYHPDISSQSQADREARKSVSFQVAVKLAGAVHSVIINVSVNR
jgi:hypothetical protein